MTARRPTFAEHEFRKATRSEPNQDCVRLARRDNWVELRDDKTTFGAPDDHRLVFTADQFDALLTAIRTAQPTDGHCLHMNPLPNGTIRFSGSPAQHSSQGTEAQLNFTRDEVAAFLDGVINNEFKAQAQT